MRYHFLKNDLAHDKSSTTALFLLMMLAACLFATAIQIATEMMGSINHLLTTAKTPHFVQLHTGPINPPQIKGWAQKNPLVTATQITPMLNLNPAYLYLGTSGHSEKNSVMNMDFVIQNKKFDFLLSLDNQIIEVAPGHIAVPIYFMKKNKLHIGDPVKIADGSWQKTFAISDFVRDAQMNPSIVHSKRFVVNPEDYKALEHLASYQQQYLITFRLSTLSHLKQFTEDYGKSPLPHQGPQIAYPLLKLLNGINDGALISIILLSSLLVSIVAILCLRFSIQSIIESDCRSISVMKAIGVAASDLRSLYGMKYTFIISLGCLAGYIVSHFASQLFLEPIFLLLGPNPSTALSRLPPLLSILLLGATLNGYSWLMLRKMNALNPVTVLKNISIYGLKPSKIYMPLRYYPLFSVNTLMGAQDVINNFRQYIILYTVFTLSMVMITIPTHLLNTVSDKHFVTFMGVGISDIRIDLQNGNHLNQRFQQALHTIKNDKDITQYAATSTGRYPAIGPHGTPHPMNIESGDFSTFPIQYVKGRRPITPHEIALSYLNSKNLNKHIGDTITLLVHNQAKHFKVTGIYQDITNGGLTAKAILPSHLSPLWHMINLKLKPSVNLHQKIAYYKRLLYPAMVSDIQTYLSQTLGGMIQQIRTAIALIAAMATTLSILITIIFLKLMIKKNQQEIATLRALGCSIKSIQWQYTTRIILTLILSMITGIILSGSLGQYALSLAWSFIGAPQFHIVFHFLQTCVLIPSLFILLIGVGARYALQAIPTIHIRPYIQE